MTTANGSDGGPALEGLRREIMRRVTPVMAGVGVAPGSVVCRIVPVRSELDVRFDVPVPVPPQVERALAVRVLDAVRGAGRTFGPVHVTVIGAGTTDGEVPRPSRPSSPGTSPVAPA